MNAVRKLIGRMRDEGFGSALGAIRANLAHYRWLWRDSLFDRRYGVKTSGYILPDDIDVAGGKSILSSEYEPSPERTLKFIFDRLPVDLRDYTLIDYGSGMGRVLLVAAEYPFKRVIGIEFSPRLHEIALENISQYRSRSQKCFDITSVCIDAALFDLPDDPCVIYMFDPFRKAVLEKLVSKIGRSYIDRRRKIVIVYYAPIHKEVFDAAWFLREMKAITLPADRSGRRPYKVALYETVPAGVLPDAALATPPTGLLG